MPTPREISAVTRSLGESGLINIEASVKDHLMSDALTHLNPGELAGWYAVGGEHYVIVCGAQNRGGTVEMPQAMAKK